LAFSPPGYPVHGPGYFREGVKRMKKILYFILCLLVLSLAGICSPISAAGTPLSIKVGVYENNPKIFTDSQGWVAGFWPDILEYIAGEEGWDIQYVHGTWTECLQMLENNTIDVMPDVAYSEDRQGIFNFSREPVYISWSRVYAPQGSDIHVIPDLEGKSIAILKDSINAEGPDGIKALAGSFDLNCTFIETESYLEVFELLDTKQADAGVVSKDFANSHEVDFSVMQTDIVFQPARLYFAFPKESAISAFLVERIDSRVKELKEYGDSIYFQTLDKWFGANTIEKPVVPDWLKWSLIGIAALVMLLIGVITIFRYQFNRRTKELAAEMAERNAAKHEINALHLRQEAILSAVPDIIVEVDKNKVYTWVNQAGYQFFGEDVIGKEASYYFEGEQDVYSRVNPIFQGDKNILYLESWQRRRDGEKRLLAWWCRALMDDSGNVKGALSTARDVTERNFTERALKESEEELRHIFEAVPESISIMDLDGVILDVNPAMVSMHGYQSKAEIIGRKSIEFIAEKDRHIAGHVEQETFEKGLARDIAYHLIRKDGTEFPAELSTAVIKDDQDKPVGVLAIAADVTNRILARKEHQKVIEYRELDRLKTNLLSTISHELRTPLASIKGYASLLLMFNHKLDKAQKTESIEAIDRSTDRLTELIDHLLDMSRLDAGLLRLTLQPVNMREIICAAVDEVKLRSPKYNFKNQIKDRLPETMADGRRLRQVLDNILENAVKYSPEGTEISVLTEIRGNDLLISISDQGRGIDKAEHKKIFERMYRIEQRLQKDPGGLGLGLSLCKALVEGHGGKIWVESKPGKGSTFYFTIPLKAVEKGNKDDEREKTKTGRG
jgi:PAS domain S-box-containing protein